MEDKKYKIRFIQKLAFCLHTYGAPCYRIEAACNAVATKLGFSQKTGFFSTPTSLFSTFIDMDGEEESRLMRVEPATVNLRKLSLVDDLAEKVAAQQVSSKDGYDQLNILIDEDDDNRHLKILSYGILASNFTLFLNGHWRDCLIAFFIGIIVGFVTSRKRNNNLQYLSEGLAALVATVLSYLCVYIHPEINPPLISLASLIVLVPGLNLTISISELASNNLTSGNSRLVGAIMVLFKLAFGVYVGKSIIDGFALPDYNDLSTNYSFLTKILLFPLAALGFTFTFKAALKDFKWILIITLISITSSYYTTQYQGVILGTFAGAFAVTIVSNAISRFLSKPVLLTLLPGIIMLVPGSLGYKSISLFFYSDAIQGVGLAFQVTKIAMSLVAGLFFGNVIINPRRNI